QLRDHARAATDRRKRPGQRLDDGIADGGGGVEQRRCKVAASRFPGEARQEGAARMSMGATRDSNAAVAPLRPVKLAAPEVLLDRRPDGTIYLRSPHPLGPYPDKLTQRLEHWAAAAPDRVFLAQRTPEGPWRTRSYAQMLAQVRAVAQSLLQRPLSTERPIAILSGNDIEHALLGLAAQMTGIPYAPISVPYSLMSSDFGKLKSIMQTLTPGLVFVASGKVFSRAIEATVPRDVEIVVTA